MVKKTTLLTTALIATSLFISHAVVAAPIIEKSNPITLSETIDPDLQIVGTPSSKTLTQLPDPSVLHNAAKPVGDFAGGFKTDLPTGSTMVIKAGFHSTTEPASATTAFLEDAAGNPLDYTLTYVPGCSGAHSSYIMPYVTAANTPADGIIISPDQTNQPACYDDGKFEIKLNKIPSSDPLPELGTYTSTIELTLSTE